MNDEFRQLRRERDFWRRICRDRLLSLTKDCGLFAQDFETLLWITDGPSERDIDIVLGTDKKFVFWLDDHPTDEHERKPYLEQYIESIVGTPLGPPQIEAGPAEPLAIPAVPAEPVYAEIVPEVQECRSCKRPQPLDAFAVDSSAANGRVGVCRLCLAEARADKKAAQEGPLTEPAQTITSRITKAVSDLARHMKTGGLLTVDLQKEVAGRYCLSPHHMREAIDTAIEQTPKPN